MIAHDDFVKLRLSDFCDRKQIVELSDWEFMGKLWTGEAIGFSEWLRPEATPNRLECLSIDFAELPIQVIERILEAIDLPIRQGMTLEELASLLGEPVGRAQFCTDRVSYSFRPIGEDPYTVDCTLLNSTGLTYCLVTMQSDRTPRE